MPAILDDSTIGTLLPDERAFALALRGERALAWTAGRVALRTAFDDLGGRSPAILATSRGAPLLPDGLTGSISHKSDRAVALAARADGTTHVGVDLEIDRPGRVDIGRRVLAADEQLEVADLPEAARRRETLLRFSIKEAVYKALDRFVARPVDFSEVAVRPHTDGGATVQLRLCNPRERFTAQATWRSLDGFLLTTARVDRG